MRGGVLVESSQTNESSIGVKCDTCKSTIHSTTDHNEFDHFKRCEKIQATKAREPTKSGFTKETNPNLLFVQRHIREPIWMVENQNDVKVKQIRTDNETEFRNHKLESFCDKKEISQNFSSPYTPEQNGVAKRKNRTLFEAARTMLNGSDHLGKFDAKTDDGYFLGYFFVSKAFRVFNIRRQQIKETYHMTFNGSIEAISHSLSELTQDNEVPEVIALNKRDIPHTEDTEGPPDLIKTEGTHEQNVQNDQMITQPTNVPSWNNNEVSRSMTESLVIDVTQSHISNQASTSSLLVRQDRWSRDQHIELVNIISDPGEGMLTTASTSECLFVEFLSETKPKKVSEALKHKKYEHGITTKNKARLVAQGYSQEEGINYDETFEPVARMKAIRILLAFATYMNFKAKISLRVFLFMIRVKRARPMMIKSFDSWDLDNNTWGGWGKVIDTIPVDAGVLLGRMGEKGFWREKWLRVS
nr:hypothetical protein [Tanacetum cinerariifolium]